MENEVTERPPVPLVDAAHLAKISYATMHTALLRGDVAGRRGANGRWFIDPQSFEKYLSERSERKALATRSELEGR